MFDFLSNAFNDQDETLERLRLEVACLSTNLETLANRPEMPIAKMRFQSDDHVELFASLSYEPVDPIM